MKYPKRLYHIPMLFLCFVLLGVLKAKAQTEYQVIGTGAITEAALSEFFGYPPATYPVVVEKATDGTERYRIKAPFGQKILSAIGYKEDNYYSYVTDVGASDDLCIDARDPDDVRIDVTNTGIKLWTANGTLFVGASIDGRITKRGNVISASPGSILVAGDYPWKRYNSSGEWSVTLPSDDIDYKVNIEDPGHYVPDRDAVVKVDIGGKVLNASYMYKYNLPEVWPSGISAANIAAAGTVVSERGDGMKLSPAVAAGGNAKCTFSLQTEAITSVKKLYSCTFYIVEDDDANWITIGRGEFTDPFMPMFTTAVPETFAVEIQEHKSRRGYLRIKNPYAERAVVKDSYYKGVVRNHYIYINAENPSMIHLEESPLCFDFGNGLCVINSKTNNIWQRGESICPSEETESLFGVVEGNAIVFPDNNTLYWSTMHTTQSMWQPLTDGGKTFRLTLPADYRLPEAPKSECRILPGGRYKNDPNEGVHVSLGTNVVKAVLDRRYNLMDINPPVVSASEMERLSYDSYYVVSERGEDVDVQLNIPKIGKSKITVDLYGKVEYPTGSNSTARVQLLDNATFYVSYDDDEEWTSLGKGRFSDPFLHALGGCEPQTYDVEVQEHRTRPGYLRIKNPYATSKEAQAHRYEGVSRNDYIYINAEKEDCIYIEEAALNLDFGKGLCVVSSVLYERVMKDLAMGYIATLYTGKVEDGVLTFPKMSANKYLCPESDSPQWRQCTASDGEFRLVLPANCSLNK